MRSDNSKKKEFSQEEKDRQKRAMERLTGGRANVPRPSAEKKNETVNRATSQNRGGSTSLNKGVGVNKAGSLNKPGGMGGAMKKDSAKELLMKMKEIKAHYNNQGRTNNVSNKNVVSKISDLSEKKI